MKQFFVFILFFAFAKFTFSQFYINANYGNNKVVNKSDGYSIITGNYYLGDFSTVRENQLNDAKVNLALCNVQEINVGYKINKNLRINLGIENFVNKNNQYNLETNKTNDIFIDTIRVKQFILGQETTDFDFSVKMQKIGLSYYYPVKRYNFFVAAEVCFSRISLTKEKKETSDIISPQTILYDSMGNITGVIDKTYTEINTKTTTDEYFYKNSFNFNYTLGIDYSVKKNISLVFKITYSPNNFTVINKTRDISGSTIINIENEPKTSTSSYEYSEFLETNEKFFYPTLRISLGMNFIIPTSKEIKEFFTKKKNKEETGSDNIKEEVKNKTENQTENNIENKSESTENKNSEKEKTANPTVKNNEVKPIKTENNEPKK